MDQVTRLADLRNDDSTVQLGLVRGVQAISDFVSVAPCRRHLPTVTHQVSIVLTQIIGRLRGVALLIATGGAILACLCDGGADGDQRDISPAGP
jgi:hypothetical protein